jgi:hypothetical protein
VETAAMLQEAALAAQLFSKQIPFQSAQVELLVPQVAMVEMVKMQFGHLVHPYSYTTGVTEVVAALVVSSQ